MLYAYPSTQPLPVLTARVRPRLSNNYRRYTTALIPSQRQLVEEP